VARLLAASLAASLLAGTALAQGFQGPIDYRALSSDFYVDAQGAVHTSTGVPIEYFHQAADADYGAALNRACAAGVQALLGPTTYPVSNFSSCTTGTLSLKGVPGKSIIQRQNANVGAVFFGIKAPTVWIDGVTFDANKAAVTANQWGVLLNAGGQTVHVARSVFENNSGSLGSCFALTSTGPAAGGAFEFIDNEVTGCAAQGTMFASVSNGVIRGNHFHDNASSGATINSIGAAAAGNYSASIAVTGNRFVRNATGLAVGGFGPPYVWANILPSADGVLVQGNVFTDNTSADLALQGDHANAIGNLFTQVNAAPTFGILCNSRYSHIQGNTINLNGSGYGIDCGGAIEPTITDNQITVNSGTAIDPGGTTNGSVRRNRLILSGTAAGVVIYDVEGDAGGVPFPQHTSALDVSDNTIEMNATGTFGVRVFDNAGGVGSSLPVQVKNNRFISPPGGGFTSSAITYFAGGAALQIQGNTWNGTTQSFTAANGNNDVVVENVFDVWTVPSGTSPVTVRAFVPTIINSYNAGGSFLWVIPSAGGSGYTAATTLTATCSGTNPTGVALVPLISQGAIYGVRTNTPGSGCVGTPGVTATDSGGGSGAAFTVVNFPTQLSGRAITVNTSSPTILVQTGGGATGLRPQVPLLMNSAQGVIAQLTAISTNLWSVQQLGLSPFSPTALPPNSNNTCTPAYAGAQAQVINSATGKWLARCNGTNWLFADGTTVN